MLTRAYTWQRWQQHTCRVLSWQKLTAYRLIPAHPLDHPLQAVEWCGSIYIDPMLPFGLRSASKLFNAVADGLEWYLCQQGICHVLPMHRYVPIPTEYFAQIWPGGIPSCRNGTAFLFCHLPSIGNGFRCLWLMGLWSLAWPLVVPVPVGRMVSISSNNGEGTTSDSALVLRVGPTMGPCSGPLPL